MANICSIIDIWGNFQFQIALNLADKFSAMIEGRKTMDEVYNKPTLSNLEQLVLFASREGPELIPVFLSMIEICFHSDKNSLQEVQVIS